MSYILDALKKIELEKNKKLAGGKVCLAGDLFQERKQPAGKAGIWKVVALLAIASLVTFTGTWFVLRKDRMKSVKTKPPVASPQSADVNSVSVPAAQLPLQSKKISATPSLQPSAPVQAVPARVDAVAAGDNNAREVRRPQKQIGVQQPSRKQQVQTVTAPADIKLSGIAWQEERPLRRAVVNGFLLKEGAVVSGATLTDIQADRVRFSSSAGLFELKLDGALPAEVKK